MSSFLVTKPSQSVSIIWKTSKSHSSHYGSSKWLGDEHTLRRDDENELVELYAIVMVSIKVIHDFVDFVFVQFYLHFSEKGSDLLFADAAAAVLVEQFESLFEILNIGFTEAVHKKTMEYNKINIYINIWSYGVIKFHCQVCVVFLIQPSREEEHNLQR